MLPQYVHVEAHLCSVFRPLRWAFVGREMWKRREREKGEREEWREREIQLCG